MARVQVAGATINAQPLRQLPNGDWLMRAEANGPRWHVGSDIQVKTSEIIEMAAAEMPIVPSPIIVQDKPPMTVKLAQLASMAADTHKDIEAKADAALTRLTSAKEKANGGIDKLNGISAQIEKSVDAIDDFANQISNGGPPLSK